METDNRKVNLTREIKELMKHYMSNDNVNLVVDLMIKREDRLYDVIQKGIDDEITLMQTIGNLKINLNIAMDALNQIKKSESHHSDDLKIASDALRSINIERKQPLERVVFPPLCGLIDCKLPGYHNHKDYEVDSNSVG